jgi:hypothetical protein
MMTISEVRTELRKQTYGNRRLRLVDVSEPEGQAYGYDFALVEQERVGKTPDWRTVREIARSQDTMFIGRESVGGNPDSIAPTFAKSVFEGDKK